LTKELDEAKGKRTDKLIPTNGKKSKKEVLSEAGLTKSTAYRYEDLAGVPIERFEVYIKYCCEN